MNNEFWTERWESNQIGFHQERGNPLFQKHFGRLQLPEKSTIFIPLCGKTKDIHWLLEKNYKVVGVELSPLAIDQLFSDLNVKPEIVKEVRHLRYKAKNIDIYVGDFFKLKKDQIPSIDAIYDRAALVALPESMRTEYGKKILSLFENTPQLLLTFEYDQSMMSGPPFSIDKEELDRVYGKDFNWELLESQALPSKFKGTIEATEKVWLHKN